jgi:UDP-N-acetylmuramate--alanine ligase
MKIFCIGIGGIGVSAYAYLQQANGHTIVGSDATKSQITEEIHKQGITVYTEHTTNNIDTFYDLVVYSAAVPQTNPERMQATALGIRQLSYFEAVGELINDTYVIAICGTHGKSSTTAMIAQVLTEANKDPTVIVGTKVPFLQGTNWRKGSSGITVIEACEFNRSFLHIRPNVILLLNADGDHFDTYKNQAAYEAVFTEFIQLLPSDGILITHMDDATCERIAVHSGKNVLNADVYPLPHLQIPGLHMQKNAQVVVALEQVLPALPIVDIQASLLRYSGCWRRLEYKGTTMHSIPVIDDYGHHPVEITANIEAMRQAYPLQRLVLVFQPHTHQRTIDLYTDFTTCFSQADVVCIVNTYDVRRSNNAPIILEAEFCKDIERCSHVQTLCTGSLEETATMLRTQLLQPNDVLICMGAGNITNLAAEMVAIEHY